MTLVLAILLPMTNVATFLLTRSYQSRYLDGAWEEGYDSGRESLTVTTPRKVNPYKRAGAEP